MNSKKKFDNDFIEKVDKAKEFYMNSWGKEFSEDFQDILLELLSEYEEQDEFDKKISRESKDELIFLLKEQSDKIKKKIRVEEEKKRNIIFK